MFINFMKYDFKECIRRLKNEIDNINNINDNKQNDSKKEISNKINEDENQNNNSRSNDNQVVLNEKLLLMTESDVDEWLVSKQFKSSIVNSISPCNGKILYQMWSILQTCPEFFYTAMRSDSENVIGLKDLASFAYELNCLFR
jgi:hypothetical protein